MLQTLHLFGQGEAVSWLILLILIGLAILILLALLGRFPGRRL